MALNLKNPRVETLAAEIAEITGESKTEVIRRALEERRERLRFRIAHRDRRADLKGFLEREVWPCIPQGVLGTALTRGEEDALLGYGEHGV